MDQKPDRHTTRKRAVSITSLFGYLMVLVYLGLGTILLFTELLLKDLPYMQRAILGGLFLVYGLIRGFGIVKRNRQLRDTDEDPT